MAMVGLFERLDTARPPVSTTEEADGRNKSHSIERLLNWLVNNWPRDIITARQFRNFGPYPIRSETKAILDLAHGLVERRWLFPVAKPRQHNMREWKIGRSSQQKQQDVAK
jgi:hypothetical protein